MILLAALVSGCAGSNLARTPPVAAGMRYVAMGSSYAAGPGIPSPAEPPGDRCGRSTDNYAHQLAREMNLALADVSCSGAMTRHILGPWGELLPQIEAVTPDTKLVTITIGGNDVGYVGHLFAASCADASDDLLKSQPATLCGGVTRTPGSRARIPPAADEAAWQALEANLHRIDAEIRRRAPRVRVFYVDYVTVLPDGRLCREAPLAPEDQARALATSARLARLTRAVAKADGVGLIRASRLTKGHDVCAREPWAGGFVPRDGTPKSAPYHPNARAMQTIAHALARASRR